MKDQLAAELSALTKDFGRNLKASAVEVAAFVAQQGTKLGAAYGQAGFELAQAAALDTCRIHALGAAVREADDFDGRVLGAIGLALRIGAAA